MASFNWPPSVAGGDQITLYPNFAAFPASDSNGALGLALDTDILYAYSTSTVSWRVIGGPGAVLSIGTIDTGTASANGAQIVANALILQSASATRPGLVNNTTQTFTGVKTFSSAPLISTMTAGSILFAGASGVVSQDNANLFWDDATNSLCIHTNTPVNAAGITISPPAQDYINLMLYDPYTSYNAITFAYPGTVSTQWQFFTDGASNNFKIGQAGLGDWITVAPTTGYVGINNGTPLFPLDVNGGINCNALTDSGLTLGSIVFAGTGGILSQNNSRLFWDDTLHSLCINNTSSDGSALFISPQTQDYPQITLYDPYTSYNAICFSYPGTISNKWQFFTDGASNNFKIGQAGLGDWITVAPTTGYVGINNGTPGFPLDVNGAINSNSTITGTQLVSTIATGTAPLVVSSTTQVANLNAATAGSATTATTATNLAGGSGGTIPYQSAAGTTSMLANGTAGQILQSNGTTTAPSWGNIGAGTVTSVAASGPSGIATWSSAVTGAGTLTQTLSTQTAGTFLAGPTSGSAAAPTFRALQVPTVSVATAAGTASGTGGFVSGTYTSPAGCLWIEVEGIGGGGGGGGSGTSPGTGTAGGNTTFSTLTANGGAANGGAGGTATGGDVNITGGVGQNVTNQTLEYGGMGAAGPYGGQGMGGPPANAGASASGPGSGGGGGGMNVNANTGAGGSGGGYFSKVMAPGSYSYSNGSFGTSGAAGTGGFAGGVGALGMITVREHYQ